MAHEAKNHPHGPRAQPIEPPNHLTAIEPTNDPDNYPTSRILLYHVPNWLGCPRQGRSASWEQLIPTTNARRLLLQDPGSSHSEWMFTWPVTIITMIVSGPSASSGSMYLIYGKGFICCIHPTPRPESAAMKCVFWVGCSRQMINYPVILG